MYPAEAERNGRDRRQQAGKDGAECSDHVIKAATISILSQLRKYETVLIGGKPRAGGPSQR
jgi:hypothetical protein